MFEVQYDLFYHQQEISDQWSHIIPYIGILGLWPDIERRVM
jgi:hypothetical protein